MPRENNGLNISISNELNVRLREFVLTRQIQKLKTEDKAEAKKIAANLTDVVSEAIIYFLDAQNQEKPDDLASEK